MKLNKKQIHEWVEALLSGEYEQGNGYLLQKTFGDRFCCLGVACDVWLDNYWVESAHNPHILIIENEHRSHPGKPPLSIHDRVDKTLGLGVIDELMTMNDNGKTFAEIAEYIETKAREAGVW